MACSRISFVYLSGTGNTFAVTRWLGDVCAEAGAEVELVPLDRCDPAMLRGDDPGHWLGLAAPTHGFVTPWAMIAFALSLPRGNRRPALVATTRAGMRWGPVELPGIAALNPFLLALILLFKGFSVRGLLPINMPSNWLAIHWGLHPKNAGRVLATSRPRAERVMRKLLAGGHEWLSVHILWEALWALVVWPLSLAYLLIGRRWLAKLFFANNRCVGCGHCARICPLGAIRMTGAGRKRRPYWLLHCESCMRCMAYCPTRAIEAGQNVGVLSWFLIATPLSAYALPWLLSQVPGLGFLGDDLLLLTLMGVLGLPMLVATYWLLHQLLKVRLVNLLFSYTTLTHWWRLYHLPGLRAKTLTRPTTMDKKPKQATGGGNEAGSSDPTIAFVSGEINRPTRSSSSRA